MAKAHTLPGAREIPADSDLTGLSAVLDPHRMLEAARAALTDRSVEILDSRIEYLRYKPETNCLVSYTATCRDPRSGSASTVRFYAKAFRPDDFAHAGAKADLGRRLDVPLFPPVFPLTDECAVLYFYPNDAELDGLRLVAEPKKIQRVLYEQVTFLPQSEWRISDRRLHLTLVRYKPEKRAVLRIDTRATHRLSGARRPLCVYLRTYVDDRGAQVHAIMESLYRQLHGQAGVTTPKPRGYLPERRTLLMDGLSGTPLTDCLNGEHRLHALQSTARALALLHRAEGVNAPVRSATSLLEEVEATGRFLERLVPDTRPALMSLLAELRRSETVLAGRARGGFVHGDFYHGQVLIDEQVTALLDFDRSYLGDVAADLGNFGAHLQLLERQKRIADAAGAFEEFVAAYETEAKVKMEAEHLRFWQVFGLLQLAVRPFRTLEPSWAEAIRTTLADCMRILS